MINWQCNLTREQEKAFLAGKIAFKKGADSSRIRGEWALNGWNYERGYQACMYCKTPDMEENKFFWKGYERAVDKLKKR